MDAETRIEAMLRQVDELELLPLPKGGPSRIVLIRHNLDVLQGLVRAARSRSLDRLPQAPRCERGCPLD